jgi:hypothetical protein
VESIDSAIGRKPSPPAGFDAAGGTGASSAAVPGRKGDVFTIAYADEAANSGIPAQFPPAR